MASPKTKILQPHGAITTRIKDFNDHAKFLGAEYFSSHLRCDHNTQYL